MHGSRNALALLLLFACCMGSVLAQSFSYQGMLKTSGIPANGAYDFRFRLWSSASGGSQIGFDMLVNDLTVQNGLFTTELNFGNVWDGSDRYLEIAVRPGASTGAYTTLAPRVKISRAPYSIRAEAAPPVGAAGGDLSGTYPNPTVVGLRGRPVGAAAPASGQVLKWDGSAWSPSTDLRDAFWQASGSDIFYNAGKVGIGTGNPFYPLHVVGSDTAVYGRAIATGSNTYGGWFEGDGTAGRGVYGRATAASGATYGVYGESWSTDGSGVLGCSTASTGTTVGVLGQSNSTSGKGIKGEASASSGTTYGVYGWSGSTSGTGVFGWTSATSGGTYGVYGRSDSASGMGVFGWTTAATGFAYGVYGQSDSESGRGIFGYATATSGYASGVYGLSDSPSGAGIVGWARASGGTNYGVLGQQSTSLSGYGVYALGRLAATVKQFQIDHPLRPENAYLNHFCTEAPEPLNAYSGNVTTDAQGYAVVQLPDYFEAINRDFRYQLTVIDGSDDFVLAKVVREVQDNRFVIRTSKPNVKVSWEVKAIRNDRWVQEYGYQAEQPKPAEHRGKYLHPELYGQPKEMGIHYRPMPERVTPPAPVER